MNIQNVCVYLCVCVSFPVVGVDIYVHVCVHVKARAQPWVLSLGIKDLSLAEAQQLG